MGALFLALAPAADAQPRVTFIYPEEGAILAQPPPTIRMCLADPVNIRDLDKGGDFRFAITNADGIGLGHRIIFQHNGLGVDIIPGGILGDPPEGEWTFEWRITDFHTLEPTEGTLHFTVDAGGDPVPEQPPQACPSGGPALLRPTPTATPAADENASEDDDGPGILFFTVIAMGSVGGVAALGLVLLLVRRRTGLSLRRPPPGGEDGS